MVSRCDHKFFYLRSYPIASYLGTCVLTAALSVTAPGDLGCGRIADLSVVISGVITRVTRLITHIRGLTTLLITTHEPPSRVIVDLPASPNPTKS